MKIYYHLPGLFEFYDFYKEFLKIWSEKREYFYDWCDIGSIYGAPSDALWGGGRVGFGDARFGDVLKLVGEYGISARLTFSNSELEEDDLEDYMCNKLCEAFEKNGQNGQNEKNRQNGVIVHSELLLKYLRKKYPGLYLVSSTTKVLTDFKDLEKELEREEFRFVVPDFRLNKSFKELAGLPKNLKSKVEFLCNECCDYDCKARKECYKNVSLKALGKTNKDFTCASSRGKEGYRFSVAMKNPGFIGIDDIVNTYAKMGFSHFKIEGRGLGSAILLEFILYYMVKPEYQLLIREEMYLDSMLDLF